MNTETIVKEVETQGYSIVENVLDLKFREKLKAELEAAIEKEVQYHGGKDYDEYAMVLLLCLYGGAFLELLDYPPIWEPLNAILGKGCILYSYASTSMPPHGGNRSCRIHVDLPRVIPGYLTNVGVIVALDDFTEENGATYFLPGSQERLDPPSEEEFYQAAKRLVVPAGSLFFVNPRVWHAGGKNQTDRWRHAVTIGVCRPWMKQRMDIPRAMEGLDLSGQSDSVKQKLGLFAQTPGSYDEYYVPMEKRKFSQEWE